MGVSHRVGFTRKSMRSLRGAFTRGLTPRGSPGIDDDTLVIEHTDRTLTREEIEACIPHRPPFLWLDEVLEISDKRIVARKVITPDLDVFRGHYPNFPVLPGVLQCEAALQAGAVLISRLIPANDKAVPVATRIQNVQFRKMVRPGDTLAIEVELTERLGSAFFLKGKTSVNGQTTCRLEFACAEAPIGATTEAPS